MCWLTEFKHHVVRRINNVINWTHSGLCQALSYQLRRRAHDDIGQDAHAKPTAKLFIDDLARCQL